MAYQRKAGDKITFWKINHSAVFFAEEDLKYFLEQKIIIVNRKNELDMLATMCRGDYFYLCHGNNKSRIYGGIKLIGRIVDDGCELYQRRKGCFQRHYEMLFPNNGIPLTKKFYDGSAKEYTPAFFDDRTLGVVGKVK